MIDDEEKPDDVPSMMEKLWGPRDEGPVDDVTRRPGVGRVRRQTENGAPAAPAVDASVNSWMEFAKSEVRALRSDVDMSLFRLAEQLAGTRDEAVAAADARVAGAEARLLSRLDEIAGRVAQATAPPAVSPEVAASMSTALTRLDHMEKVLAEEMARPERSPEPDPIDVDALRAQLQEQFTQGIERLEERMSRTADADGIRLRALVQHMEETVERLTERDEVQAELRVALEGRVDQLAGVLDSDANRAERDGAIFAQANVELARIEEQLNERLDRMAEKAARSRDADAEGRRLLEERVQERLGQIAEAQESHRRELQTSVEQRLDRIAEKAAGAEAIEADRRQGFEAQIHDGLDRMADELESHRRELQTGLREGLAEVQGCVTMSVSKTDGRLEALEERLGRNDDEVSELNELHSALDIGLGALRSEIAEVRNAVRKVAGDQADIQDQLEAVNRIPRAVLADAARGRKPGRKGESGAHVAVAIESAEILARDHQQLKAEVARLEQAAEAATAAAARASSQASTSGPLRSDVRLLQEQLAAQNEALAAVSRGLERLRRKVSTPVATKISKPPGKASKG